MQYYSVQMRQYFKSLSRQFTTFAHTRIAVNGIGYTVQINDALYSHILNVSQWTRRRNFYQQV